MDSESPLWETICFKPPMPSLRFWYCVPAQLKCSLTGRACWSHHGKVVNPKNARKMSRNRYPARFGSRPRCGNRQLPQQEGAHRAGKNGVRGVRPKADIFDQVLGGRDMQQLLFPADQIELKIPGVNCAFSQSTDDILPIFCLHRCGRIFLADLIPFRFGHERKIEAIMLPGSTPTRPTPDLEILGKIVRLLHPHGMRQKEIAPTVATLG